MQLREYTLQEHEADRKQELLTTRDEDRSVTNILENSTPRVNSNFKYDVIDAAKKRDQDILESVLVEPITPKTQTMQNSILSNEIPVLDITTPRHSYRKSRVGLFGSKQSPGFRSASSVTGYHASTSPENFLKKKYKSKYLKKAQQKIHSGSLDRTPKSELFQHILAQYKKGGIKMKKKKLRRRRHKRHRSKFDGLTIYLSKL